MAMAQAQSKVPADRRSNRSAIKEWEWRKYGMDEGPAQVVERTRVLQAMTHLRRTAEAPDRLLRRAVQATVEEGLADNGIGTQMGDPRPRPLEEYILHGNASPKCAELLGEMRLTMDQFAASLVRKLVDLTNSRGMVPAGLLQ